GQTQQTPARGGGIRFRQRLREAVARDLPPRVREVRCRIGDRVGCQRIRRIPRRRDGRDAIGLVLAGRYRVVEIPEDATVGLRGSDRRRRRRERVHHCWIRGGGIGSGVVGGVGG